MKRWSGERTLWCRECDVTWFGTSGHLCWLCGKPSDEDPPPLRRRSDIELTDIEA